MALTYFSQMLDSFTCPEYMRLFVRDISRRYPFIDSGHLYTNISLDFDY